MMWEYKEAGRLLTYQNVGANICIYCCRDMVCLPAQKFEKGIRKLFVQLTVCPYCGWWNVYRVLQGEHPRTPAIECYDGAIGSLRELDLTDISVPRAELRSYLVRRADALCKVHPRRFEEVVCSVFRDLGHRARAPTYSRDGGVDLVLEGSAGTTVGVQVKCYAEERRFEAEQIRSLAGALLVNGHRETIAPSRPRSHSVRRPAWGRSRIR